LYGRHQSACGSFETSFSSRLGEAVHWAMSAPFLQRFGQLSIALILGSTAMVGRTRRSGPSNGVNALPD
jgi:hypothetical protein